MKKWKSVDTPEEFSDVIDPLYLFVRDVLKDRKIEKDFKYEGYSLSSITGATCVDGESLSKAENRRFWSQEKSRPVLMQMLMLAVQIGIEQGSRIEKDRNKVQKKSNIRDLKCILNIIEDDDNKEEIKGIIKQVIDLYDV